MFEILKYEETTENDIFIDVRSKKEFDDFHIPGAINFPILNDEERKIVGTLYDNGSKREAKRSAIRFVSSKLLALEDLINEHNSNRLILICQRGGYRSTTAASLFFSLGYNVYKLQGGIKSYRHYINENLENRLNKIDLITLYGPTGSGKTKILKMLKNRDYPVIDLEKLANHMGSNLGSVGLGKPNSQKMFESLLFLNIENPGTYFIEGESKRIGNVVMPEVLYQKIVESKKVYLDTPIDLRVKNLVKTYAKPETIDELKSAIDKLSKYLGRDTLKNLSEYIINEDYENAAKILCEKYYDHNYNFSPDENTEVIVNNDFNETVLKLQNIYDIKKRED